MPLNYFFLLSLFYVDHFFLHIYHFCLLLSLGAILVMALCDGECGLDFLDGFIFFPSIYFLSLPAHVSSPPVLCFELSDSLGALYS